MLGAYYIKEKKIMINKEGLALAMSGQFSPRNLTNEKPGFIYIMGQESPEELLSIILNNEPEYRASLCLFIYSTIGVLNKSIVKDIIRKVKKLDLATYKELEKTDFLKLIGLKSKWKFWQ